MNERPLLSVALVASVAVTAAGCGGTDKTPDPAADLRPAMETGSVEAGGFNLRYAVEGNGIPTLVVGSALYYPRAFSQNLRQHLRFVFMDHRGFAPSAGPRDTTAFALDSLIDDMERVRQHLQLGRIVVVGHSGHAYMALEYAKKYPASVSHVVMIGIAPDLSAASSEAAARYWDTTATAERKAAMEENLRRVPDSVLAKFAPGQGFIQGYIRNGPRAWYDPHFDSTPLWEGVDINMEMFNYVWGRVFRDIDVTRGLSALDRPVYVALGRYDYLVAPPSSWERVRPAFKDVTIRVFDRSGHTPQYEEAQLFDDELLAWLRRPQ